MWEKLKIFYGAGLAVPIARLLPVDSTAAPQAKSRIVRALPYPERHRRSRHGRLLSSSPATPWHSNSQHLKAFYVLQFDVLKIWMG